MMEKPTNKFMQEIVFFLLLLLVLFVSWCFHCNCGRFFLISRFVFVSIKVKGHRFYWHIVSKNRFEDHKTLNSDFFLYLFTFFFLFVKCLFPFSFQVRKSTRCVLITSLICAYIWTIGARFNVLLMTSRLLCCIQIAIMNIIACLDRSIRTSNLFGLDESIGRCNATRSFDTKTVFLTIYWQKKVHAILLQMLLRFSRRLCYVIYGRVAGSCGRAFDFDVDEFKPAWCCVYEVQFDAGQSKILIQDDHFKCNNNGTCNRLHRSKQNALVKND